MAGESFNKNRQEPTPEARQYHAGFEEGRAMGFREGVASERARLLTVMQTAYLKPDVERNTPEAKALLKMANEVSKEFREIVGGDA